MSSTSAIGLWTRNDRRSRLRSLVLLGLLAGLTAGIAIAAYDGSVRTGTALERLESRGNASDAAVFTSQTSDTRPSWTALAARPEVAAIARWRLVFGLWGQSYVVLFGPVDDVWLQQVDRPIVVAGRMADPSAPNEIVVTAAQTEEPRLHLGDVVHLDTFGPYDPAVGDVPGSGPSIDLTVVGMIQTSLAYEFTEGAFVTPAFFDAYGDQIEYAENAMVQLRNARADIGALRSHAGTDLAPGVPVLDLHVTARRVTATTDVEQAILALLASIIALTGLVFVGQALTRSAAAIATDAPALRALGMTRRDLMVAGARSHLVTVGVATVTTFATATVASRWFPVGLAAQVDPDRGIRIDATLFTGAAVLTALLATAAIVLASWLAAAPEARRSRPRVSLLSRIGLVRPVTAGIGMRMAFGAGRHSERGSSRAALLGAIAAVAGVVSIITLNHGLDDSLGHPEVAGVAWDVTVTPAVEDTSIDGVKPATVDAVIHQPGLAATGTIGRFTAQIGSVGVPTFTVIDRGTAPQVSLVTLSGRAPVADDEVTLGPSTARDLGVTIGDTVPLPDGTAARVVGLALFPTDVHAQFDEGAWVSNSRWRDLVRSSGQEQGGASFSIAVRFADRDHIAEQGAALAEALGPTVDGVAPADLPEELTNLHNVRRLPTVLAIFLTMLGIAAVGHALFTTVRRRRRDLAVLQALGITRRGTRIILAAQGSLVALVGLLAGVPLGLLAGRAGWRAVTDRVPLTFRSPFTVVAVVLVIPVAIVIANVLAVLPGHRASRMEPAAVLRTE